MRGDIEESAFPGQDLHGKIAEAELHRRRLDLYSTERTNVSATGSVDAQMPEEGDVEGPERKTRGVFSTNIC
jgi:hypothetical protein